MWCDKLEALTKDMHSLQEWNRGGLASIYGIALLPSWGRWWYVSQRPSVTLYSWYEDLEAIDGVGGKGDWTDSHLYNDCQSEDFMTWCHFATGVRNPFVDLWFPKHGLPAFSWSKSHVVGVSLALYSSEAKIHFGQERAYLALATVYQGLSADRRKMQKGWCVINVGL